MPLWHDDNAQASPVQYWKRRREEDASVCNSAAEITCVPYTHYTWLLLILMNNSQSCSWSIAWMGCGALCVCGRRQPGQLHLKRCCGWLFHHIGRKRILVSYEWQNACVEEPRAWNLNWCSALVLLSVATRPTCSGCIPTWPVTTLYNKANLKSLRWLCFRSVCKSVFRGGQEVYVCICPKTWKIYVLFIDMRAYVYMGNMNSKVITTCTFCMCTRLRIRYD